MSHVRDLELILRSRTPLVTIESRDEARVLTMLQEAAATRPLSVIMDERISALRPWADGRTVPCH